MPKFKAAGREWDWPKMTTRIVSRVRDEHKLDLRGLLRKESDLALALADDEIILAVFCDLCADQIAAAGMDKDELAAVWDEDAVSQTREALVEGFFTLCLGPTKAKAAVARMREAGL